MMPHKKPAKKVNHEPRIGLALGSGGSRSLVHVGVIKALVKAGIKISAIAGSSTGALIGAMYAQHEDIAAVEKTIISADWKNAGKILYNINLKFKGGLIHRSNLLDFVNNQFGKQHFYDLKVPCAAVAARLSDGQKVVFDTGPVSLAILASMAFPMVFKPVLIGKEHYIDGGLVEPVPVTTVKAMESDIVIAVNLDGTELVQFNGAFDNPFDVLFQAINVYRNNLATFNTRHADIKLDPKTGVRGIIGWEGFSHLEEVIKSGERAMRAALPQLRRKIERFKADGSRKIFERR